MFEVFVHTLHDNKLRDCHLKQIFAFALTDSTNVILKELVWIYFLAPYTQQHQSIVPGDTNGSYGQAEVVRRFASTGRILDPIVPRLFAVRSSNFHGFAYSKPGTDLLHIQLLTPPQEQEEVHSPVSQVELGGLGADFGWVLVPCYL
jgi:hypothetical protein